MVECRPMRRLLVYPLGLLAVLVCAQTAREVEVAEEKHHHLALENEIVRVFKVEVAPHDSTLLHRHRHDYVFVTLGASQVSNEVEGKPPAELKFQDGETRFVPGNFAHVVRNLAPTPFVNVTVELLQDEKAHSAAPPKWDEERGLQVLERGTQEILFVKDGARVLEVELQPGGMMPSHHHNGPHLLVAITDLEVRSDVDGQGPMPGHFKSGDSKWLPGGYTHTLTNVGKQTAKFVTIEFP
jgi:quercetin dioxygenase-like cupin family protein